MSELSASSKRQSDNQNVNSFHRDCVLFYCTKVAPIKAVISTLLTSSALRWRQVTDVSEPAQISCTNLEWTEPLSCENLPHISVGAVWLTVILQMWFSSASLIFSKKSVQHEFLSSSSFSRCTCQEILCRCPSAESSLHLQHRTVSVRSVWFCSAAAGQKLSAAVRPAR